MSHTALRRIAIRLLHDPGLVHAMHASSARALSDADLSADEIGWLLRTPIAAWRTDPDRQGRLLRALEDEFPASVRLAARRAPRFVESPHFHAVIQHRGSLAAAFASFLAEDPDERVAAVAMLEGATAAVRRAPRRSPPSPAGYRRMAPHARIVRVRLETPALLAALRTDGPLPTLGTADDAVLVLRHPETSEVTIESLSEALYAILQHAEVLVPVDRLVAAACHLGADPTQAHDLLRDLVTASILV
jgi:hypothetical protein